MASAYYPAIKAPNAEFIQLVVQFMKGLSTYQDDMNLFNELKKLASSDKLTVFSQPLLDDEEWTSKKWLDNRLRTKSFAEYVVERQNVPMIRMLVNAGYDFRATCNFNTSNTECKITALTVLMIANDYRSVVELVSGNRCCDCIEHMTVQMCRSLRICTNACDSVSSIILNIKLNAKIENSLNNRYLSVATMGFALGAAFMYCMRD